MSASHLEMNSSHSNIVMKRWYDYRSWLLIILMLRINEILENLFTTECIHLQMHHQILIDKCSTQWYYLHVEGMRVSLNSHNYIKETFMPQLMFNIIERFRDAEFKVDHNYLFNFDGSFESQKLGGKH